LTTNVAIALCTVQDLSHDLCVEPRVYIKSGITRFIISWTRGYSISNT